MFWRVRRERPARNQPPHSTTATAFYYNNLGDLIQKLREAVKGGDPECKVTVLELNSHSGMGHFRLGMPRYIWDDKHSLMQGGGKAPQWFSPSQDSANELNVSNAKYIGQQLRNRAPLGTKCLIILTGCVTGNESGPGTYPQVLANGSGCTVIASGGFTSGSFYYGDVAVSRRLTRAVGDYGGMTYFDILRRQGVRRYPILYDDSRDNTWYVFEPEGSNPPLKGAAR